MKFWAPPDPNIAMTEWRNLFWSGTSMVMLLIILGSLLVLVGCYFWLIRRLKIQRPTDPFVYPTTFWWLSWILAAIVPGVIVGIYYRSRFLASSFENVNAEPTAGMISAGLFTWFVLVFLFEVVIILPGVTPSKFRNHPWLLQLAQRTILKSGRATR